MILPPPPPPTICHCEDKRKTVDFVPIMTIFNVQFSAITYPRMPPTPGSIKGQVLLYKPLLSSLLSKKFTQYIGDSKTQLLLWSATQSSSVFIVDDAHVCIWESINIADSTRIALKCHWCFHLEDVFLGALLMCNISLICFLSN